MVVIVSLVDVVKAMGVLATQEDPQIISSSDFPKTADILGGCRR